MAGKGLAPHNRLHTMKQESLQSITPKKHTEGEEKSGKEGEWKGGKQNKQTKTPSKKGK